MARIYFDWPDSVPPDQINEQFIQGMLDRMAMSFYKYGHMRKSKTDGLANVKARIQKYEETRNKEWLLDAANYLMMEFTNCRRRGTHFRVTGSNESPGSIKTDGTVRHNKLDESGTNFYKKEGD